MTPAAPALDIVAVESVQRLADPLAAAYGCVFAESPWYEGEKEFRAFRSRLAEHGTRPGFRLVLARSPAAAPARSAVVGFSYGFVTPPPLGLRVRPGTTAAFRIAELAVVPSVRRQGLARRLHDTLLEASPEAGLAWLVTDAAATAAMAFYRHCGWQPLMRLPAGDGARRRQVLVRVGTAETSLLQTDCLNV